MFFNASIAPSVSGSSVLIPAPCAAAKSSLSLAYYNEFLLFVLGLQSKSGREVKRIGGTQARPAGHLYRIVHNLAIDRLETKILAEVASKRGKQRLVREVDE